MARYRKVRLTAISFLACTITLIAAVVVGVSPAPDPVKLTPSMVRVDTSSLPPDEAQAELEAVWRLFDGDTMTAYTPQQTAQVTVSLSEEKGISRIRTFGASSYHVNVYLDNAGNWEPVPSITGIDLSTLGSSWNSLKPSDPVNATHLLLEFIPQGNTIAGLPEIEIWGEEPGTIQGNALHTSLEGITTPREALHRLAAGTPHIIEFMGAPSELTVTEDTGQGAYATINIPMTQDPVLFKRAYLLYDGYNILRPVSIGRRINSLAWTGGFALSQPEGTTPAWTSHLEEINPAWLVQGENRIEFRSPNGTAYVRGLRLIVETDSGWNAVSSVSDSVLYDRDTKTSVAVAASSTASEIQVDFERPMEPEMLRLHLRGPINTTAVLQYKSGTAWQDVQAGWQIDLSTLQTGWNDIIVPTPLTTEALRLVVSTSSLRYKPGVKIGEINELRVCASPAGPKPTDPRIVVSYPRDGEYFGRIAYIQGFATPAKNASNTAVSVSAEGKAAPQTPDGSFSLSLTKDETQFSTQNDDEAWGPVVSSAYGTEQAASRILDLTKNTESLAALAPQKESRGDAPFADNRDKHSEKVSPGQAKKIAYAGVSLDIPAGAVDAETEITIIPLTEAEIARLNPGMINVTYPAAGYRFLPHGIKFKKAI
ncbi:MAG TPA: hypothetical protein DCO77_12670, partial [Nitrospiraceae bacterium]|nr:hypothetical protein [Nitrospiraceae bacterium]